MEGNVILHESITHPKHVMSFILPIFIAVDCEPYIESLEHRGNFLAVFAVGTQIRST